MKKILLVILLFVAVGCSKEEEITATLGKYRRDYDVNSSDPILKYVSIYNKNTGKHFIVDPDTVDYMFNIDAKHPVRIKTPKKDEAHIMRGIKLMEELFLDGYNDKLKKTIMPYSLILGDSVLTTVGLSPKSDDYYVARNFIVLNIGEKTKNLTEDQKVALSSKLHADFIGKILIPYSGFVNLDAFYAVCSKYGESLSVSLSEDALYALGFLSDDGWFTTTFPGKEKHAEDWIKFLLTKSKAEQDELTQKHEKMRLCKEALDKCFKQNLGIDYNKLIYVKK